MIDLSVPQRQSLLAIVFLGLRILRSLGIAQIIVVVLFILRAPFNGALSVLPFVIIAFFSGFSALAWWRYTFQVLDDELVVTKGILRVVCLNVPIEPLLVRKCVMRLSSSLRSLRTDSSWKFRSRMQPRRVLVDLHLVFMSSTLLDAETAARSEHILLT